MPRSVSFLFAIALLLSAAGCDTEKTAWLKMYGTGLDEVASWVRLTSDGGYIVAGAQVSSDDSLRLQVFKLSKGGVRKWTRTYDRKLADTSYGRVACIEQTSDGGYIVVATVFGAEYTEFYVVKLSSLGVMVWSRTFGGSVDYEAHDIHQTTDGGYVVCGLGHWYSDYHGIFLKLDSDGDIEWEKSDAGYLAVEQTADGGYITIPYDRLSNIMDRGIVKLDPSGVIEWSAPSDSSTFGVEPTSDGGYIESRMLPGSDHLVASGHYPLLIKRSGTGAEEWRKPLDVYPFVTRYYSFVVLPAVQASDGGYLCAITIGCDNGECSTICLRKLDAAGTEVWTRFYNTGEKAYYMSSMQPTPDGGCIISAAGRKDSEDDMQALIMKFDKDGLIGSVMTPTEY